MLNVFSFLAQTTPGMPADNGWLALTAVILLSATAVIDAYTGRVPDVLILPGLLLVTAIEGFCIDWVFAGQHLAMALAAGFLLYFVNEAWRYFTKHDAFGLGDAKWTMLAVSCFGPLPGFIAWALGAWLGLGWMGIIRLCRKPIARVHFAPFLLIGLLAGIYWLRLR